ncbi:MAG: NmrA family NAD(P)-binding protein [Erysipelotrichaceae bacterium]|nr:NmrA family NAD(P)-binding protein [Erysipelotrichaceae bacterium]MBQ1534923.1 NmrA family NAD(P)-binding protein [Erysipelotrichaceae bacterium]
MKILLAGAFGNLGFEILKALTKKKHEIIAADLKEKEDNGLEGKYTFRAIDATNPETLKGICDGVDIVITTMGLTTASAKFTAYDIDYQGNMNLYKEAVKAGVKKFNYISVIACDLPGAEEVPMLHAKYMVEEELKKGSLEYVIYRPTGYFYDIAKVFKPYVDKGEMQLLKGYHDVKANVVDCPDFAKFIVDHMKDSNVTYEVGGKETYTYEEMAKMCFRAAGKPVIIKDSPIWMFSLLANLPKIKKEGKHDIILFSKWTLSHDLVGKDVTGDASFAEYIKEYFGGKK